MAQLHPQIWYNIELQSQNSVNSIPVHSFVSEGEWWGFHSE